MKRSILIANLVLGLCALPAFAGGLVYETSFTAVEDARMLNVDFHASRPGPDLAERVLRDHLATAAAVDGSRDIVGTVFYRDEMIRAEGYTPQMRYSADDGEIASYDPIAE